MSARILSAALLLLALTGCSVRSTSTLDENFKACLAAGGDYSKPVEDGIGFSCTLPEPSR